MIRINLNSKLIFTTTFLIICLLLAIFSYYNPAQFLKLREKGYFLGSIFHYMSFNSKQALTDFLENTTQAKKIKKESELLKNELNQLIFREKNHYQELEITNQRLQKLLNFKEVTPYELISAKVLAYSPEGFFQVIYIDRGKKDGVIQGMGVVNPQGLVGKVVEVYLNEAKVMLIIDKRSNVGVRVQKTRDIGILQGTENPEACELHYILTKAELEIKDTVTTSGLGETFPPGIIVGYILSAEKNPNYIFQQIKVEPAVNFGKLEELFLLAQKK